MSVGQILAVESDGGVVLHRELVAFEGGLFFVCKPEEIESAEKEGCEPVCIVAVGLAEAVPCSKADARLGFMVSRPSR
jgi:hypothetical protein